MTDLLDEVLRDQSDEKKLYYFRKILPIVIGVSIIVVIGMLVNNWYQDRQLKYRMQMGDILIKAMASEPENSELALSSLDNLSNKSDTRVSELAALKQVGIKVTNNDLKGAKDNLEKMITNKSYHDLTSSYVRILWLNLVIDEQKISDSDQVKLEDYLKYFNNETQAFYGTASLLKAMWYIKSNQPELAADVLKKTMALNNATIVTKEQAKALLATLK